MKFNLELTLSNAEGALERVLGKLRQRSVALLSVIAGHSADRSCFDVRITVEATRPIEPAVRQLGKLYDVQYVTVRTMEGNVAHVYRQDDAKERLGMCASL